MYAREMLPIMSGRFGVRIPALLISPRIPAGMVFRAKSGTIDHTSVLKLRGSLTGAEGLLKNMRREGLQSFGDSCRQARPGPKSGNGVKVGAPKCRPECVCMSGFNSS
jgi:hypothetical protein